jgi:hypothetical protein
MAAPLRVPPGPGQAHSRKISLGCLPRAAGTGMGCSIISAMHHGRLGTMGSRHSSGADLLLSHYTSLVVFRFLSDEACPRHAPLLSAVDRLESTSGASQHGGTGAVGDGQQEKMNCRRLRLHAGERHAAFNHREQSDVTRRSRHAVAMEWVEGGCQSGVQLWRSDRPHPSHRDWQAGRGIIRV